MLVQQRTVLSTWFVSVLEQFDAQGIPIDQLRDGSWLHEASLISPTRPLQLVALRRLWHQAMKLSQTPMLGIQVGLNLPLQAMHILAWIVMHSPDLRQALKSMVRFQGLVSNSGQFELQTIPGGLRIAYMITACPVSMHSAQVDSAFAGLLGLLRRCCSIRLSPEVVALPGVSSILSRNYENALQCNAVAHSERPFMSFHTADLDRPHPGADPELLSLALRQAGIMLRARSRTDTLVDHVQAMIVAQGVDRADCASVASSMSVSVRTLQRRLEGCGTGFRRLLEATRMEEAVRLLGDRSQTLTGIAEILGYSDLSGLSHAVRSHWGSSPRHLREEILSTSGYATLTEPSLARQMNSN